MSSAFWSTWAATSRKLGRCGCTCPYSLRKSTSRHSKTTAFSAKSSFSGRAPIKVGRTDSRGTASGITRMIFATAEHALSTTVPLAPCRAIQPSYSADNAPGIMGAAAGPEAANTAPIAKAQFRHTSSSSSPSAVTRTSMMFGAKGAMASPIPSAISEIAIGADTRGPTCQCGSVNSASAVKNSGANSTKSSPSAAANGGIASIAYSRSVPHSISSYSSTTSSSSSAPPPSSDIQGACRCKTACTASAAAMQWSWSRKAARPTSCK
mmetsp:Transcript_17212/g.44835  ORF Transcript_17212/g.44835 Transcript_17212/m.44835 type:complete len:266 (-) Transcript_17212:539-1336(-)